MSGKPATYAEACAALRAEYCRCLSSAARLLRFRSLTDAFALLADCEDARLGRKRGKR